MNNTINYYNLNAKQFVNQTVAVDFNETQEVFLSYLKQGARILDFGCGSGRDTKCFLEHGYQVDAIDGSEELCKIASDVTGIQVKQMLFQDLDVHEEYDAIWACSSILHLSEAELAGVMKKMAESLCEDGMIYTSFKYGVFEGERNGRYFIDFDEKKLTQFLSKIQQLQLEKTWITSDVRPGRGDEKWLNVLLRKR